MAVYILLFQFPTTHTSLSELDRIVPLKYNELRIFDLFKILNFIQYLFVQILFYNATTAAEVTSIVDHSNQNDHKSVACQCNVHYIDNLLEKKSRTFIRYICTRGEFCRAALVRIIALVVASFQLTTRLNRQVSSATTDITT